MAKLVYLLNDSDFTFFNIKQDGVQKAVINKIAAQVYVADEYVGDFVEHMISEHFGGYLIPSEYEGEIVFSEDILNNEDLLPEYPENFNWGLIEDCLPNYYQRDEVLHSDLMSRFVDEDQENPEQSDIDWMVEGKPEYLTEIEWVFHQMSDLEIQLFDEAGENK